MSDIASDFSRQAENARFLVNITNADGVGVEDYALMLEQGTVKKTALMQLAASKHKPELDEWIKTVAVAGMDKNGQQRPGVSMLDIIAVSIEAPADRAMWFINYIRENKIPVYIDDNLETARTIGIYSKKHAHADADVVRALDEYWEMLDKQ